MLDIDPSTLYTFTFPSLAQQDCFYCRTETDALCRPCSAGRMPNETVADDAVDTNGAIFFSLLTNKNTIQGLNNIKYVENESSMADVSMGNRLIFIRFSSEVDR